jgi:hypothetical protein
MNRCQGVGWIQQVVSALANTNMDLLMRKPPIFSLYLRSQKRRIRENEYQSGKTGQKCKFSGSDGFQGLRLLFVVIWIEGSFFYGCICETLLCKCLIRLCAAHGKPTVCCRLQSWLISLPSVDAVDVVATTLLGRANIIKTMFENRTFTSENRIQLPFPRSLKRRLFIFSNAQLVYCSAW